ncbi:MAG TPA: c-type cytochrome biogenesis protein CcsB, partial [Trinickia sp.]|nr:c-type cytochrome biogenesis protein CcsB [Trinickia sp.]
MKLPQSFFDISVRNMTRALRSSAASAALDAPAPAPAPANDRSFYRWLTPLDWLYALAILCGEGFALSRYHAFLNYYDKLVLIFAVPALIVLGWRWKPARPLMAGIAALALLSIDLYHGDLSRADSAFLLKYFLSSQSAILWMCAL